jgi:hypothetical protein
VTRTVLGVVKGADVDMLACSLHRPMVFSCQRGDQSFRTGATPSHHAAVVLTIRVPVRPNLIWRSSHLPGHAYPTSELSW